MDSVKLNSWLGVVANIGVLIGIVFLAVEIRTATNIGQAQMSDAAVAGHNEINLAIMSDPQLARMFIVGMYEPEKLSDAEAVQFSMWVRSSVNQQLRLRRMRQLGFDLAEEEDFELGQIAGVLSTPGGKLFLDSNREVFPEYLLEQLQPYLGEEPKDDHILGRKSLPLE